MKFFLFLFLIFPLKACSTVQLLEENTQSFSGSYSFVSKTPTVFDTLPDDVAFLITGELDGGGGAREINCRFCIHSKHF